MRPLSKPRRRFLSERPQTLLPLEGLPLCLLPAGGGAPARHGGAGRSQTAAGCGGETSTGAGQWKKKDRGGNQKQIKQTNKNVSMASCRWLLWSKYAQCMVDERAKSVGKLPKNWFWSSGLEKLRMSLRQWGRQHVLISPLDKRPCICFYRNTRGI